MLLQRLISAGSQHKHITVYSALVVAARAPSATGDSTSCTVCSGCHAIACITVCNHAWCFLQLYIEAATLDAVSEGAFERLKSMVDVGDIVGASGGMKRTDKGELSVAAAELQVRLLGWQVF